ncbi:MAG: ABC-2 type transport system permease protein [Mariniblastus sp.]|jgi:ABC-2 type transport system permease protein
MSPLIRKYIAEGWLLFVGLALGVFVFTWFRVWIVGELDTAQFRQIIDLLPKDWRKFATVDFDWLVSYLGRTSLTLDEPMLITMVCAWGLVRGSDVVSGELSRGTMEMLLSQPVSRRQVYLTHAKLTIVFLVVLVLIAWLGMAIGIWTTSVEETTYREIRIPIIDYAIPLSFLTPRKETIEMSAVVNPLSFAPGLFNLFCLGFCLSGFAAFCSSIDRYRWRTLGIAATFYFCNAGLKMLGMGSERYSWVENCSLFGLYHPASIIERAQVEPGSPLWLLQYDEAGAWLAYGTMSHYCLLLVIGAVLYWLGLRAFVKRDLPAPT